MPGYMNPIYGRGRGFGGGGFGRGRGWRNMYYATGMPFWGRGYPAYPWGTGYAAPPYYGELTLEREMEMIKTQTEFFEKQIEVLNERIRELESIAAKKKDGSS
jgi:hypothetical protein